MRRPPAAAALQAAGVAPAHTTDAATCARCAARRVPRAPKVNRLLDLIVNSLYSNKDVRAPAPPPKAHT